MHTITFCLPHPSRTDRQGILSSIVEHVDDNDDVGFAGYLEKPVLSDSLATAVFGDSSSIHLCDLQTVRQEIELIIHKAVADCIAFISLPQLYFYIFPTQSNFYIEKMGGVNGFSPYMGAIHIYMSNSTDTWRTHLRNVVVHEITHAISRQSFPWDSLLDSIIFEGLGEHFKERIADPSHSPWVTVLSHEEALKILAQLDEGALLEKSDMEIYQEVFYGSSRFPQWAGYCIGYVLIATLLEHSEKDLRALLSMPPAEVYLLYKKTVNHVG